MARGSLSGRLDSPLGISSIYSRNADTKYITKQKQEQIKKLYKLDEDALKKSTALRQKYDKLVSVSVEKELKNRQKMSLKMALEEAKERADIELKSAETTSEKVRAIGKKTATVVAEKASQTMSSVISNMNTYINAYGQYMSGIQTRLQGFTKDYYDITDLFTRKLGASPYVSQQTLLTNLSSLVKEGIAYNIEQRAFLMTVSDKIATTFDVANGTLLRLIRIQQADSTAARLGLESSLNKFLNKMYQDTSYLNSLSKTVSSAIIEANSQMSMNQSIAFEYNVQKWLGSLSSVGVSESTVSSLATGLGYLGSGNISALSSNQTLQNLLIMAANQAGLDYSAMLTRGMSAQDVNALMKGLVQYTQTIATTENQVVKSAYANMFGLTMSDLSSIMNLTSKDLVSISNNMLDYSSAINETENSLSTIGDRIMLSDKIKNAFENVMYSMGGSIASNAFTYGTWMLADLMQQSGIDPKYSVKFFGSGIDSTVATTAKTAIVGVSLLTRLGAIVSSLTNNRRLGLTGWGAEDATSRGSLERTYIEDALHKAVSSSTYIGGTESTLGKTALAVTETSPEVIVGAEDSILSILQDEISQNVENMTITLTSIDNKLERIQMAVETR